MRLELQQAKLLEAARWAALSPFVEVSATAGRLVLRGGSPDDAHEAAIDCPAQRLEPRLAPSKLLLPMIASLPKGITSLVFEDRRLTLAAPAVSMSLALGRNHEDMPGARVARGIDMTPASPVVLTMRATDVLRALGLASEVWRDDEGEVSLAGAHLRISGGVCRLEATDRYSLAIVDLEPTYTDEAGEVMTPPDAVLVLPRRALLDMLRLAAPKPSEEGLAWRSQVIEVIYDANDPRGLIMQRDLFSLHTRLKDTPAPELSRLFFERHEHGCRVDVGALQQAVARVSVAGPMIGLHLDSSALTLSSRTEDGTADAVETVPALWGAASLSLVLDARRLLPVLRSLGREAGDISLLIADPLQPVRMSCPAVPTWRGVIQPVTPLGAEKSAAA